MHEHDHVMSIIERFAEFLGRIVTLSKGGAYQEARQEADRTSHTLLGMSLDEAAALLALGASFAPEQLRVLHRLLEEDAQACARLGLAQAAQERWTAVARTGVSLDDPELPWGQG